ncbi:phosphoadenosine phosphosulfate reductase family protein [Methanolapillus millepedarum]|uniref:Phosphoadenosine phosphosulfate reductase n=1 Tax=Methanolapillus millepedarum TaxID=3028296 RepID=A0AA96V1R5_9EURY|nr:Phosphoadenosine phosphosulfate reductase [Methanosarcinaceae archaeon Ac7]
MTKQTVGSQSVLSSKFSNPTGHKKPKTGGYHAGKNDFFDNKNGNDQNEKISSGQQKNNRDNGNQNKNRINSRVFYENDSIYWCNHCNLPLIGETCGLCQKSGREIKLSQPADVRFAQGYDIELVKKHLIRLFSCDPLEGRVFLLNKIPGDDQTLEIIADGFLIGILRFDLKKLDFVFELAPDGARLFFAEPYIFAAAGRIVDIKKAKSHLNGKNISIDMIENFPAGISAGETILLRSGNLIGYGISHVDSAVVFKLQKDGGAVKSTLSNDELKERQILKVKNIAADSSPVLSPEKPGMDEIVAANKEYIKSLGKDALNTIKGVCNAREQKGKPVYVSFSGGKDSLVVLDLATQALQNKSRPTPFTAIFFNTGIDYPETIEFARNFCAERSIPFKEFDAGDDFWKTLKKLDHPTKDSRWCCKVCKLNSGNKLGGGNDHISLDGKRKHESFMRAKIPAMDTNPNVAGQLNVFPIREWRAIEVWLYIHWRNLPYNPLYDNGLERIGCWMCPAAFQAEYSRMSEIHPELAEIWENYLDGWAAKKGVSKAYTDHGFWRWEKLPPKMIKLSEELEIDLIETAEDEPEKIKSKKDSRREYAASAPDRKKPQPPAKKKKQSKSPNTVVNNKGKTSPVNRGRKGGGRT